MRAAPEYTGTDVLDEASEAPLPRRCCTCTFTCTSCSETGSAGSSAGLRRAPAGAATALIKFRIISRLPRRFSLRDGAGGLSEDPAAAGPLMPKGRVFCYESPALLAVANVRVNFGIHSSYRIFPLPLYGWTCKLVGCCRYHSQLSILSR